MLSKTRKVEGLEKDGREQWSLYLTCLALRYGDTAAETCQTLAGYSDVIATNTMG